ncbi:GlcG/HbpS family heme-binding protein [Roseiarcus sp.]|uniref:GlcG/HbpS family heme-binding protein n=1 Tax=Roseiarcus sp. TaxID=1969460 RepID=UPI003F977BE4
MSNSVARRIINSAAALRAVEAAVAKGRERNIAVVAAVVDIGGDLVACLRADGAFSASVSIANDKAYTAAVFGASTDDLSNALKDNPVLHHGIAIRPGVALFGGGLPIVEDGAVIGAIGVSGGSEDDDRACAKAGASALAS